MSQPIFYMYKRVKYDLSHLLDKSITIILKPHNGRPKIDLKINVTYSNHCYSARFDSNINSKHDFRDSNNQPRSFNLQRYKASLLLPKIIQELDQKKCFFTYNKNNYLIIEPDSKTRLTSPYYIVFVVRKNKHIENGLYLSVITAYLKTMGSNQIRRGKGTDRIKFIMIARKILNGESIKKPPS